ncbi:MAG: cupredoxin domain-containing protein [Candidatus Micrarchaeota archaeon]
MERNMLLLFAVAIAGILGLVIFAQMTAPRVPVPIQATVQPPIILGGGEPAGTSGETQVIDIRALGSGVYDKPKVTVKAGVPVKLRFSADQNSGCGRQLMMPDYGVSLVSRNGETVEATFTPQKGSHAYRCGMNMFRGVLTAE